MSTNYYVNSEEICITCGRGGELLHLGKSAYGWCFSLRIHPDRGISTLDDWKKFCTDKQITDEYGRIIPSDRMWEIIEGRQKQGNPWTKEALEANGATLGPNGLARHGWGAVPGDGTYDICDFEFS